MKNRKKNTMSPITTKPLSKKNTSIKKEKQSENDHESNTKKTWSVKDLKESLKPTNEELEFRENKSKESDIFKKSSKFFRCTKCLKNFNSIIKKHDRVPVHPVLGVLMCQKCNEYYEDGEFSVDSDGEDKYCRWCGEGGTILGCAKCICGFCATCVKKHFKIRYFKEIRKNDNWLCFLCDPKPLWYLRFISSLAVQASESVKPESNLDLNNREVDINNDQSLSSKNLTIGHSSKSIFNKIRKLNSNYVDDESEQEEHEIPYKRAKLTNNSLNSLTQEKETDDFEKIKSDVLNDLQKVLKLTKYHLSFGIDQSNETLNKLGNSKSLSTNEDLLKQCKKIKRFLSILSTYLVQFCSFVNSIETSLLDCSEKNITSDVPGKDQPSYTTILQFLGFLNSQIEIFMEKGIPLSEILNTEVHSSKNIIGFLEKYLTSVSKSKENISSIKNKTESSPNCHTNPDNKKNVENEKANHITEDKDENISDNTEEQNSDMNSSENDKELSGTSTVPYFEMNSPEQDNEQSSSGATLVGINDIKEPDMAGDVQEILLILENA